MALLSGTPVKWVSAKNGALNVWNKEKQENERFYGLEGVIQSIAYTTEPFKETVIGKYVVKIVDSEGGVFSLKWTAESWYTHGFFCRLANVDLTKPVIIGASGSEKNEKVTFCWLKQGEAVKKDDKFPTPHKVEKRNKVQYDYDELLDAADALIEKLESEGKLQPGGKNAVLAKADEKVAEKEMFPAVEEDEETGIPF